MPHERTIFIGDIHGCAAEFEALLDAVVFRSGRDRLLLTGDAFTRGPDPLRVWELIDETGADMVLGNHDDRQLRQFRAHASGGEPRFKYENQRRTFDKLEHVSRQLLAWLEARPLYIEEEDFLLVHAGIHPDNGMAGTARDEFLRIRTWPAATGSIDGPRWHDVITPLEERTLVFGHDAPGGLVVHRAREGDRPWLVGLDSACIYGGSLSAWIQEEDRIVQIDSRQGDGSRWWE
ncbi:MAG: metallophosphoesterase [Candidatus Latescibacteria bacterium]|nr:metallophosphoesterase [Candidatus Latescibacterota bacterium]HJP31514.1 metallophosphoesterase [Candidatus Latescibacterota bacterium]